MALNLETIARNVDAERQGEWIESVAWPEDGVQYKLRSMRSPEFRRANAEFIRRRDKKFGDEVPDPEWIDREFALLIANHILMGWSGITPEYSTDVARNAMTDKRFSELHDDIVACARKVGRKSGEDQAEDLGN